MFRRCTMVLGVLSLVFSGVMAQAEYAFFDFSSDSSPYFITANTGALWTIEASDGSLQISKPVDDRTVNPYTDGIYGGLASRFKAAGDFTATVDFFLSTLPLSDAPNAMSEVGFYAVDQVGSPTDDRFLYIFRAADKTRTDLLGSWSNPPNDFAYWGYSSLTAGRYQIQRSDATITASIAPLGSDSFTPIASLSGIDDPIAFYLFAVQISDGVSLRPNGAMDVSYDNLSITADQFIGPVPEPSTLVLLGVGAITLLAYGWRRQK